MGQSIPWAAYNKDYETCTLHDTNKNYETSTLHHNDFDNDSGDSDESLTTSIIRVPVPGPRSPWSVLRRGRRMGDVWNRM